MVRGIGAVVVALGLAGGWALPRVAEACGGGGGDDYEEPVWVASSVTTQDGVFVASLDHGIDPDDVEVAVTEFGTDVPGEVEFVDMSVGEVASGGLLVFVPSETLALGRRYTMTLRYDGAETKAMVEVLPDEPTDLTLEVSGVTVDKTAYRNLGPRVCCEVALGECADGLAAAEGSGEACFGSEWKDRVDVRGEVELPDGQVSDPQYASTLIEVFVGVDGAADTLIRRSRGFFGGTLPALVQVFDQVAESYCVRIDVVNLANGERLSSIACEDDPGIELGGGVDDIDHWLASCADDPYWEDSGGRYRGHGDAGAESPHGDGVDEFADLGGCSCRSGEGGPSGAWSLLLGLLGLRRRARR